MTMLEKIDPPSADPNALWQTLQAMRIEPEGAAITFAAKLARENGWDRAFAEAVDAEYRRFLYLAATTPHPVSPSPAVDRAWHLHLTYSRHYWETLCGRILRRPLHHDPSMGGPAEDARHADQYARTLALYRAAFAKEPPEAIWSGAGPRRGKGTRAFGLAGAAVATTLLAACTALAAAADAEGEDDALLGFIIIGAFMALAFFVVKRAMLSRRGVRGGQGRRAGAAGGVYGGHDASSDWDDRDSGGSDSSDGSDGGSSCGSSCGGGGGD